MKRPTSKLLTALAAASIVGAVGSTSVHFSFQSSPMDYELSANVVPGEFCDPNSPLSFSGYFGVNGSKYDRKSTKHYFYWLFERRSTSLLPANDTNITVNGDTPLIIWLQGGPGCSSLLGLLEEGGPCLLNKDGTSTRVNPYSWTEVAHVLYLDQPAMAGYSYGDGNDVDDRMIAEDAYYFLQSFYKSEQGSKYKDAPLILAGISFAGHYIPSIAHRIWKGNKRCGGDLLHLPLSGLAIGNGWYDGEVQVPSYPEMLFHNPQGIKLVNETEYEQLKIKAAACARDIHKCKTEKDLVQRKFVCQKASECDNKMSDPVDRQKLSVYDIKQPCDSDKDPLCDPMKEPLTSFLNCPSTKDVLGVPTHVTWQECTDSVSDKWTDMDQYADVTPYLSEMLNNDIPVLIYSGDRDFLCNYIGNRAVALKLEWKHGDDFRAAKDYDWNNGGGIMRSSHGLGFLQVHDAGHEATAYQPEQTLKMITQFLNGEGFARV
ncbi:hypothetical protein ACHAWF_014858 [Thalassiosira exigua]